MRAPHPYVPYLEPLVGAAWWTVGAAALDPGIGTVVLAGGLSIAGALVMALRKRFGTGAPLPRGGRTRLFVLIGVTTALIAVTGTVLGLINQAAWAELSVPAACALVGLALMPLSSQLDERTFVALGGALMVLGAAGVLLALNSAGTLYPQGVVGLIAGALFWLAGAHRTGLLSEARGHVRR
jgi:hypothetical protein